MTAVGAPAVRAAALALAIIVVSGGMLQACGGDDDDPTPSPGLTTISLAFPRVTQTDLEFPNFTRTVADDDVTLEHILELLLAGPAPQEREQGVTNPFPRDTRLLSVGVTNGTVTVDLSEEVLDFGGGSANVLAIVGSIERTVMANRPETAEVILLVEGEPDAIQP